MTSRPSHCPSCRSEHIYQDGNLWICPECAHEWSALVAETSPASAEENSAQETLDAGIRDAFGTVLSNGDAVIVIKELRIKGASAVVKVGTKVKNIRLGDVGDGHDIVCKIDGLGTIHLKSEFVKKA